MSDPERTELYSQLKTLYKRIQADLDSLDAILVKMEEQLPDSTDPCNWEFEESCEVSIRSPEKS